MLNYIKAELWKVSRRRSACAMAVCLLLCTALFFWIYASGGFRSLATGISSTMLLGMLLAPPLVQLVDSQTADTLKNELGFGLRRGTVYWGKLCAALLLGLVLCAVLVGGSLGLGWLLLPHGQPDQAAMALELAGFCLLGALPVWCGMFALCHMLALTIRSTAAWVSGYYLVFFMGQPLLIFVAIMLFGIYEASGLFSHLVAVLMPYTLLMPEALEGWLTPEYQLWCWSIGLGWMAVSTALGLTLFGRRDIR